MNLPDPAPEKKKQARCYNIKECLDQHMATWHSFGTLSTKATWVEMLASGEGKPNDKNGMWT